MSTPRPRDLPLIARGTAWILVGRTGRQGFLYGALLLLARDLGASELGRFLVALAILQVLAAGATTGARDAAARYVAWGLARGLPEDAARSAAIASSLGLALSTVGALLLALGAEPLAAGLQLGVDGNELV